MTQLNLASEQLKADWQRDAGYPEIVRDDFAAGSLLQGRVMQEAPKKPQTVKGLLLWLACALVGIVFGLIVVAEMMGPHY